MSNKSYLTAIKRKKLSAPVRWLHENGYLCDDILDYGCGKGDDVKQLNKIGYIAEGYDPHFQPVQPAKTFGTVLCTYVFNVLDEWDRAGAMFYLKFHMRENGNIYITVRRDLKQSYIKTKRGTEQWMVKLDLPIVKKTSSFCIYELR